MLYKVYDINGSFIKETDTHPSVMGFCGMYEYDNIKQWFANGKRHRIGGPAVEYPDGTKYWFVDGEQHRLDGPACEWYDGTREWYLYGKKVTESQCKLLHDVMKLKRLI